MTRLQIAGLSRDGRVTMTRLQIAARQPSISGSCRIVAIPVRA